MLTGRRIVVTGASSGIGRGLTRAYADAGALVWAVGRDPAALAATVEGRSGVRTVAADLTTAPGGAAVAAAVAAAGGELDATVHAAGILGPVGIPLSEYPEASWREVFEINLHAMHLLHQRLREPLDAGIAPVVIALASTVGRTPRRDWGAYAVSKHAVEGWVALMSLEWARGRVYSVNPGGTRTPMRAAAVPGEDPTTVPTPENIAPLFLRLVHPMAPEPSGAVLEAREWIGRDPWEGLSATPPG